VFAETTSGRDRSELSLKWSGVTFNPTGAAAVRAFSATTQPPPSLLKVTRVVQWQPILDGLDGEAVPGELLAVMGPSGCGKTRCGGRAVATHRSSNMIHYGERLLSELPGSRGAVRARSLLNCLALRESSQGSITVSARADLRGP
jgi:hypothetical protein